MTSYHDTKVSAHLTPIELGEGKKNNKKINRILAQKTKNYFDLKVEILLKSRIYRCVRDILAQLPFKQYVTIAVR